MSNSRLSELNIPEWFKRKSLLSGFNDDDSGFYVYEIVDETEKAIKIVFYKEYYDKRIYNSEPPISPMFSLFYQWIPKSIIKE